MVEKRHYRVICILAGRRKSGHWIDASEESCSGVTESTRLHKEWLVARKEEGVMSRTCTVCCCEHRDKIDREIRNGTSLRTLERQFGVSRAALHRHAHHDGLAGDIPLYFHAALARLNVRIGALTAKGRG